MTSDQAGERRRIVVSRFDARGRGVAVIDGEEVAVPGLFPGDEIEFLREPAPRGRPSWEPQELTKPSPDRIKPDCPFHGPCGGCDWLELSEKGRRKGKQQILTSALEGIPGFDTTTVAPFAAAREGETIRYMPRVRIHQGRHRASQDAGFLPAEGHEDETHGGIVPVTSCALLTKPLGKRLVAARRALGALPFRVDGLVLAAANAGPETVTGHLTLGAGASPGRVRPELWKLIRGADLAGLSYGRPDKGVEGVLEDVSVAGLLAHGVEGGPFFTEPGFFSQGNVFQNKHLVREVVRLSTAAEGMRIVEGFAGAGNFTIPLAAAGASVEAVESHPGAVRMAIRNRQRSKCGDRITLVEGDAMKELGKLTPEPDVLVVDPPRTGMPTIAATVAKLRPAAIVYVACDMESLRRDALALVKAGYRIAEVAGIDLYPRTHHVEAVVKFVRA